MNKLTKGLKVSLINANILLAILLIFSIKTTSSQTYYGLQGAGNLQTGTAAGDVWSANNNQAGLAFIESNIGVAFHFENRFLIKELSTKAAAISYKTKTGTFGLSYTNFGYSQFNTNKITLGFGKKYGEKFAIGVGLDYISIFQGNQYGSTGIITFDLGLLAKASKKTTLGFHVFNPIRAKIGVEYYDEKIPVIYNLGLKYQYDEKLKFMFDIMNDEVNQIRISGMSEYKILDILYVRLGLSTNKSIIFNFGAGLHLGDLQIDFSSSMHQVLGYSPGFTLIYHINP